MSNAGDTDQAHGVFMLPSTPLAQIAINPLLVVCQASNAGLERCRHLSLRHPERSRGACPERSRMEPLDEDRSPRKLEPVTQQISFDRLLAIE